MVCVSLNDEVIHGIPLQERIVKDGDLVSVDLGIQYKGVFVDAAYTYMVGKVSNLAKKLCRVTMDALWEGIKKAKAGLTVGDVAFAVQNRAEKNGFSVIRQFVGHGIGKSLHLPPEVPNFGEPASGFKLRRGMAIAIEPMVSAGDYEVVIAPDGWTARMKDGSLSAHYEHTVFITENGPIIITE
jgi:methionyl aminopeptidase